jgi:hypothetical protein
MHHLTTEYPSLTGSMSRDLALRINADYLLGRVAIVTDRPTALLAATRKQWVKIIRDMQRERSSTLSPVKITELNERIAWMQKLTFSARPPKDVLEVDVTFATAEDFVRIPPVCRTVYVCYKFEREKLHMLTSWMPVNGLVVIYA